MIMKATTLAIAFFSAFFSLVILSRTFAADETVPTADPAPVEKNDAVPEQPPTVVLFSHTEKTLPRGLWMSGINNAEFKQIEQDGRYIMVLKGQQGVVSFNGHTPLKPAELPKNGFIRIRFRSDRNGTDNKVIFSWRLDNRKRSVAASQNFKESEQWQTITLPLPAVAADADAKGYWITFEQNGNYEISTIDVIEKQGN